MYIPFIAINTYAIVHFQFVIICFSIFGWDDIDSLKHFFVHMLFKIHNILKMYTYNNEDKQTQKKIKKELKYSKQKQMQLVQR